MRKVKTVEDGFKKLAFGNISDAVRLLCIDKDESVPNLENMDLFCVQEIKRTKEGFLEIKFYDRMKAMEILNNINVSKECENENAISTALNACAEALKNDES